MSERGRVRAPLLCGLHVELAPVGGGLMFAGRLNFPASRNQAGRRHLNDRLIDARLPLAQWTECSQPGKAVSTKERPECSKVGPEITEN